MQQFFLTGDRIQGEALGQLLKHPQAGALVVFEGSVRNHNQGHPVRALDYEIYMALAQKEGERILTEAGGQFSLHGAIACHRYGSLQLGDTAVWVGTTASHREQAFLATRYIIDQIKQRLPIWKKEYYLDQPAQWVYCRDHHYS